MRLHKLLGCYLLVQAGSVIPHVSAHDLRPRQETTITATTPVTTQTQSSTQTSSTSTTSPAANTNVEGSSSRSSISSGSISLVPSNTDLTGQPTVSPSTSNDPNSIPILPRITPATGLAGVFLLITGLIYGFIALRWQLLHNFLSVAYLGSIGVTCLIVFVQNPVVSAGTLAGYVVAVIVSSAVMAGLTSPFAELTEGVGCFVGGFCLSMWFLCLNDNGLIENKAGKIIFVLVLSISIGLLGIFRVTRRWGLITCIPFTGATAIVLGIDCFSRAGLKEFWVYVWGINAEIFPLGTSTYPVTAAIRAESMCIIVVWFFGLVANTQLWKLLRKQQNRTNIEQKSREKDLDRLEKEAGMRAELTMAHEKDLWEQQYDESKKFASSVDVKSLARMSSRHSMAESTNTMDLIETDAGLLEIGRQQPGAYQFGSRRSTLGVRSNFQLTRPSMISRASSEILDSSLSSNLTRGDRSTLRVNASNNGNSTIPNAAGKMNPNGEMETAQFAPEETPMVVRNSLSASIHQGDHSKASATSSRPQTGPVVPDGFEDGLENRSSANASAASRLYRLDPTAQVMKKQPSNLSLASSSASSSDGSTFSNSKTGTSISISNRGDCEPLGIEIDASPEPKLSGSKESNSAHESSQERVLPKQAESLSTQHILDTGAEKSCSADPSVRLTEGQDFLRPLLLSNRHSLSKNTQRSTLTDASNTKHLTLATDLKQAGHNLAGQAGAASSIPSPTRRTSRNPSQPMLQQLCESPMEECDATDMKVDLLADNAPPTGQHTLEVPGSTTTAGAVSGSRRSLLGPKEIEELVHLERKRSYLKETQETPYTSSSRLSLGRRTSSRHTLMQNPPPLARRNSDSASVYLNSNTVGQRLSQQSMGGRFDSHQPKRPEDQPSAREQALRLAQFRHSLQTDPKSPSFGNTHFESRRQQMIYEKRVQAQQKIEQSMAQQHFGVMLDQTMRNADGMYLHAKRLSRLQAQAKVE